MGKKSPGVKNRKGPRAGEMSVKKGKRPLCLFQERKEKRIRRQK